MKNIAQIKDNEEPANTIQSHMIQCSQPNTEQRIQTKTERTV